MLTVVVMFLEAHISELGASSLGFNRNRKHFSNAFAKLEITL